MSRTDKDRPYWVRLNDSTEARIPFHYHHGSNWFNSGYKGSAEGDYCCIDEEYTGTDWRRSCGYYLDYRRYVCVVPKGAVRDMYYSPMRNDERMVLRNAVKDYNTFGEIDEDLFLNEKSRHATYGGGYWD